MEKHQRAAIIMSILLVAVSFIPIIMYWDNQAYLIRFNAWIYPTIGTAVAAIIVVAAFWPKR